MKRYCQMLDIPNDEELIARYKEAHANVWSVIQDGIRTVGILDMQIYCVDNHLFMICDTVDDFDWAKDNARLAALPQQAEWEAFVAECQGCDPNAKSTEKWRLMDKIFQLDKA